MNYYNPYFNMLPYSSTVANTANNVGLFSRIFGSNGIRWGSILSGTQKVLGVANQAIPVIKQVTPVMKNAKTMFRVMNEFKKVDGPTSTSSKTENTHRDGEKNTFTDHTNSIDYSDGPTFFL